MRQTWSVPALNIDVLRLPAGCNCTVLLDRGGNPTVTLPKTAWTPDGPLAHNPRVVRMDRIGARGPDPPCALT